MARMSPARALQKFGRRQTLRPAVIIGLLIGVMMGAQGPAYHAAYPTAAARQAFITTLDATPALGAMAGETVNASEPASYSIYKSIVISTLITAIWGLLITTKLLRGQEENGRMEFIQVGQLTKQRAVISLLFGFFESNVVSAVIAFVIIAALGQLPHVGLDIGHSALLVLAAYLPGLVFASLGIFTSQLASTRGRALAYGLVPLVVLMALRGLANSDSDINWLKHFTPFGWSDLLSPVLSPHPLWLIAPLVSTLVLTILGCTLLPMRDFGVGLLHQKDTARSHFGMLHSPLTVALRLESWSFIWWAVGTLAFSGFITSLAKLSISILKDATGAQKIIGKLGNQPDNMAVAFIGIGSVFTVLILLIMATFMLGRMRRDESSGYLNTILVQPVSRQQWLLGRVGLIVVVMASITLASGVLTWYIARVEGISGLSLVDMIANSIGVIALVSMALGAGICIYGFAARFGVTCMSIIIGWSYLLDIFKSLLNLPHWVEKTSLFHYFTASATSQPNWTTISWLFILSCLLIGLGTIGFMRRDLISE